MSYGFPSIWLEHKEENQKKPFDCWVLKRIDPNGENSGESRLEIIEILNNQIEKANEKDFIW